MNVIEYIAVLVGIAMIAAFLLTLRWIVS